MTKVTTAPDSGKCYFLTIDSQGRAVDCTCADRKYRSYKPACKHMERFNQELEKAEAFLKLKARFDHRNQPAGFSYIGEDGQTHATRRIDWSQVFEQDAMVERVMQAKPARYAEAEIRSAQRLNQSRAFSLLR